MTTITFVTADGVRHTVDAPNGMTLLEAAKKHGLPVLGTCGGSRICSTCHLVVKGEDFARVGPPAPEEFDVLEWMPGLTVTSRLGCQIKAAPELEGLEVAIP